MRKLVAMSIAVVGFVGLAGGRPAWAHQDPPGCSGTAVDFSFMAFRADNTPIDLSETVSECETITYQVTIGKSSLGNPCAFEGGTILITTPDGVVHNVTPGGGVPCIGGTGACANTSSSSDAVSYTVSPADVSGGTVTASASYTAAFSHTGVVHTLGFPKASTSLPLLVEFCPASTDCVDSFCDPNLFDSATGALGTCTSSNVPNSTPCTDVDGNGCTFAGCNGNGICDQMHVTTVCTPDTNPCTDDPACDPGTGLCTHPAKPSSTPCPDTDGDACTTSGCDGSGTCDQVHLTTVCSPDGNECTDDPPCNPGTGLCTHPFTADSTPCTDTDSLACTIAGCNGAGTCDQQHVDTCPVTLDHFSCYEIHRDPFTNIPNVSIVDAISSAVVNVQRPERLCAPADKNDEDNSAPTHPGHEVGYKVRHASTPLMAQHIVNQFGSVTMDITGVDRLMVPSSKSLSGPPPALTPPTPDHFQCYKVRRTQGTPKFSVIPGVKVDDQFGTVTLTMARPIRLCIPANKNNEDPTAPSHTGELLCYKIKKTLFPTLNATINNQFGLRNVELIRRQEFCVPSLRNPSGSTTTTTVPSTSSTTGSSSSSSTSSTSTSSTSSTASSPSGAFLDLAGDTL